MSPITPTIPQSPADLEDRRPSRPACVGILATAWLAGMAITLPLEWQRFRESAASRAGWAGWLFDWNIDTTPYFLILFAVPLVWYASQRKGCPLAPPPATDARAGLPILGAVCVGLLSLVASWFVANRPMGDELPYRFGELPPAYHDEYSYLFQAQTFLAGRTWFPSHAEFPELFDQVHVLDEGKFASRYFPGTGVWIAPFLAIGKPHWGHWMAGALTAAFIFLSGWEIGGGRVAWWSGVLTALSPGLALFSNLLLSHHPTLAGLSFFLWQYLRMLRTGSLVCTALAGCGLSFAMLCRPMTAAGFGLPFGVWFAWWAIRESTPKHFLAMGAPLVLGMIAMLAHNHSITGSWTTTPYQLYTDIYTPRHVYGFNNVVRGAQHLGPKVLENYDKWAENLDGELARMNVYHRLIASGQWTWGLIPLLLSLLVVVGYEIAARRSAAARPRVWLIVAAIASLHAVHVPYWYDGIMHWHYVFETAPLWLLIAAMSLRRVHEMTVDVIRVRWVDRCWQVMIVAAFLVNAVAAPPFWTVSRIDAGVNNVGFSRLKYAAGRQFIDRGVTNRPALVLVKPDRSDRHIDYVTNAPRLNADILYGRWRPSLAARRGELDRAFPGRTIYVWDVERMTLNRFL